MKRYFFFFHSFSTTSFLAILTAFKKRPGTLPTLSLKENEIIIGFL